MTKKVIIIDDSLVSLNLIKTAFADSDWEVYGTRHAQNALKMLHDIAPDIIITDALMPVMGGFQFLKELRNNQKTSKIPVIIYSVLDGKNIEFYIKNERAEYYLKKSDNIQELTSLAEKVTKKHPLSQEYKFELLKTNLEFANLIEQPAKEEIIQQLPVLLDTQNIETKFKEKYDFNRTDEKILSDIFSILYPILQYNLFVVRLYSFEKNENIVYFDIRDIILSPILQNNILSKLNAKNSFLFKKYAPNLKVITNEEEFLTQINFNFEHNEQDIANVIFYSKEKSKWSDETGIETIKNTLKDFFRARYINKSTHSYKNDEITSKYLMDKIDFKPDSYKDKNMYSAIIEIANYKELQDNLTDDELDYINSRISEKLINFISDEEQLFRNDNEEYNIVFFAKNEEHALQKLNWVYDLISEIELEDNELEIYIGSANCTIEGQFNFYEAQKFAREALDKANAQDRIIMYDGK